MEEMPRRMFSYPPDREAVTASREWAATVSAGFAMPRARRRPRPRCEAAWLARIGTPPALIGPCANEPRTASDHSCGLQEQASGVTQDG